VIVAVKAISLERLSNISAAGGASSHRLLVPSDAPDRSGFCDTVSRCDELPSHEGQWHCPLRHRQKGACHQSSTGLIAASDSDRRRKA
jgi:hypothetical protein